MPVTKDTPLVFVWTFRVPTENHDKVVELLAAGDGTFDDQRMRPDLPYTKSRHFFRTDDGGKTETWFCFDEVDNLEANEDMKAFGADYVKNDPESNEQHKRTLARIAALTVEGAFPPTPVMYHEVEECRVEFQPWKYRKAGLERAKNRSG